MTEVEAPHNPEFKRIRFKGKVQRNSEPQHGDKTSNSPADHAVTCPECGSNSLYRDGQRYYPDGSVFQRWLCRNCNYRFTEKPPKENSKWSINTKTAIVSKRQICATIEEAKNLDTATEAKTVAGMGQIADADVKGKLIQFALYCQKDGLSDSTVKTFNTALRSIARHANINDPENVKEALAKMNLVENTKFVYSCAYTKFLTFLGKTWTPPKYEYIEKLPEFLPTEAEIDEIGRASCRERV
jgi:rubredoxin